MKRGMNTVISAVRVFCVISLVVAGLQVITACDGGDDGKEINLTYSFGCHGTYTYEDDVITITIADSTFPDEYGFQKGSEAYIVSYPADGEMTWTGESDEEIQWRCTATCSGGVLGWWSDDDVRDYRIRTELYEDGTFVILGTND